MTRISILIALLIIATGCGKDVKLDTTKLESVSKSTVPDKMGTLSRSTTGDRLLADGKQYKISIYSSHMALEFVAAKPLGTSIPVKYKGKPNSNNNTEIVLEILEAQ